MKTVDMRLTPRRNRGKKIRLPSVVSSTAQVRPGGGGGGGGSGIPIYPEKIRQNTQKYPKLMEALYTVYLKSKESDIPNTCI